MLIVERLDFMDEILSAMDGAFGASSQHRALTALS